MVGMWLVDLQQADTSKSHTTNLHKVLVHEATSGTGIYSVGGRE